MSPERWTPWERFAPARGQTGRRELVGRRVRLISCNDPWTKLERGALGTIDFVDDTGTVFVRWDDGHRLGLIPGHDQWTMIA